MASSPVLVVVSANCVSSPKFEAVEKAFTENDTIKVLNMTKMLLNEEQQQSFPVEDVSQFCSGSVVAILIQSEAAIDFKAIQKANKLSDADLFNTTDPFFLAKLGRFFFPQKQALEQTLILCTPPLSEAHCTEITKELKLKGIFVLFADQLSSDSTTDLNGGADNAEEKQDTVTCTAILCESFGSIDEMTLMIGCQDSDDDELSQFSQKYAPNSWNARLSEHNYTFTQISDAARIEALIPKLTAERTLALIKPTAVSKGHAEDIQSEIVGNGFTIISQKRVHLKLEHAQFFYKEHAGKGFYDELTAFMASGPIHALILERIDAIKCWRTLLGPTNTFTAKEKAPQSLRARYGTDQTANACHGSDSTESAAREIKFYFPEIGMNSAELDTKRSRNIVEDYMAQRLGSDETLKEFLIRGLSELAKQKPGSKLEVVEWFARWLLDNNPSKPQIEEPEEVDLNAMSFVEQCQHMNGGRDLQIIFILGGPGSGKGTQCANIIERYGFEQISTGDLCRAAMKDTTSKYAQEIREIMENGKLISTELLLKLLKDEMVARKGAKYLLDGFPRSLEQAIMFEKEVSACLGALNFVCDDATLRARCLKRAETSGRVDDNEETIAKRLDTFHAETDPTVEYLKSMDKVREIDASKDVGAVWEKVKAIMDPLVK